MIANTVLSCNALAMMKPIWLLAQAAPNQPAAGPNYAAWGVILLGIALALFFVEVIVPSGGIIGFLSACCMIAGIVMLFKFDTTLGLIGAILSLIAVPFLFAFAIKVWPNTPIARMLMLKNPPRQDAQDDAGVPPDQLVGKQGKAMTDLRPVGTCLIDGQRKQCLAVTGLIRSGSAIRVVSADGMEIKVRADD